jgi:hypothetical protein
MTAPTSLVTQANVNQQTGGLYADNGALTTDGAGNITGTSVTLSGILSALGTLLQLGSTASGSIPAPTGAAQTIATANVVNRTAPAGACTGAILAAGTKNGQVAIVTNESTVVASTITFSTTLATGLILTDATPDAHVIKASSAALFIWFTSLNSGAGAWVRVGPFGG